MDERTQGAMLLAVGGVALRLGLTDAALAYVKVGLQLPLAIAGSLLVVLGAVAVIRAFRSPQAAAQSEPEPADLHGHVEEGGHVHDHGHGPAVAWLLLLPLLALLLVAPPPLGAFAASRQSNAVPVDTATSYPPLSEPVDGASELKLSEFVFRALYDEERSLEGQPVRLSGFVSSAEDGGFTLSRFTLNCCAADARAIDVRVAAAGAPPAVDAWVAVEGTWQAADAPEGGAVPESPVLTATAVSPIQEPVQPYEY